jgi:hypothetical protein
MQAGLGYMGISLTISAPLPQTLSHIVKRLGNKRMNMTPDLCSFVLTEQQPILIVFISIWTLGILLVQSYILDSAGNSTRKRTSYFLESLLGIIHHTLHVERGGYIHC